MNFLAAAIYWEGLFQLTWIKDGEPNDEATRKKFFDLHAGSFQHFRQASMVLDCLWAY